MLKLLFDLKQENIISELNYQFAKWIDSKQQHYHYSEVQKNLTILLAALLSFHCLKGNSCLNLNTTAAKFPFNLRPILNNDSHDTATLPPSKRCYFSEILQKIGDWDSNPSCELQQHYPQRWQNRLQDHTAFSSDVHIAAPMLFQNGRLYFYRYWQAEHRISQKMHQMAQTSTLNADEIKLNQTILSRIGFNTLPADKTDWQLVAIATALVQKFCVISGGPGTGKTTTVVKLLTALQLKQLAQNKAPLQIALAAPTGKAAARLKESIADKLDGYPTTLQQLIPSSATTIHRLLGIRPYRDRPDYHRDNPLHFDLIVVDEASMIDLFIMEKLFNALRADTRLILLGDEDQLAAVEAGNIMSELSTLRRYGYRLAHQHYLSHVANYPANKMDNAYSAIPAICDSLCHLKESHRFKTDSGIGRLATYINQRQADNAWQIFAHPAFKDLHLIEYPNKVAFNDAHQWQQQCVQQVLDQAQQLYRPYLTLVQARSINPTQIPVAAIFTAFNQVRLLSALRVSELGVEQLNQRIANTLKEAGLIHFQNGRENYLGKPILITENTPQLGIYSGDIGLILPDEKGELRAYFETMVNNQHLNISLNRIPYYEPAYVMTVHKSQGSEFAHTLLVMPLAKSPVLTKELLYTAVTRAKERFTLFTLEETWKKAVEVNIPRQSGLREQLLNEDRQKMI